jgi:two-component system KDP operon response regulator KdpE
MNKVVIIDDEPQVRRLLSMVLKSRNYEVHEAEDGPSGLQHIALLRPDAVLLDLGLPAMDGLSVLKRLREWSEVPVLILSVRDEEALKVEALEAGADDYVTKPFGTAELLARLAVIQRRRFTRQNPEITAGNLTLNLLHHEASLAGDRLKLTPTEFSLLHTLAEHAGRIVTFGQIIRRVWPAQLSDQSEALRVHISHLRRKLGTSGPQIINEPAIGYRLIDS